jgi:hemerythrin
MLEWKTDYETGVPAVDTQHKVLFDNINRLETLLTKHEVERPEAEYLLGFLEQYAAQHFRGEEMCMARFRCPSHGRNKEEHAQFLDTLALARNEYAATTEPRAVLQRLHETLVWWINQHILQVDIQLKDCPGVKTAAV